MSDLHFLTALRQYLEPLASAPPPPVEEPAISDAWARELLIRTLERAEAELPTTPVPGAISLIVGSWQNEDRDVRFVRRLDQLLRDSFAHAATLSERKQMLEVGMCLAVKIPGRLQSEVRTQALLRLTCKAKEEVFGFSVDSILDADEVERQREDEELRQLVIDYAVAIRAVRDTAHGEVLTPIGQVFLDLQGRDAVRWLLRLEVHHSTGPRDPLLHDRDFFGWLLNHPLQGYRWSDDAPMSENSLLRLEDLGILGTTDFPTDTADGATTINLLPIGKELLTELLQPEDPLALLASALCADQLGAAVGKAEGRDRASSMLAAEANARQARAVAHEIRNTLLPVTTHLDLLYQEVQSSLPPEVLHKRRAVIDKNLNRTFEFIDDLVRVANLTATPADFFEPRAAVLEAVQLAEQPGGPELDLSKVVGPLPMLSGHRERFVLALVNVLRNAQQHGGSSTLHVRVSAQPEDGEKWLRITIDDNGSGVPAGEREAIFAQGYSRSSSGTGLGLHIVREVIEGELRGTVTCEDSPLGGARFTLRLPSAGTRSAQKH